MRFLVCNRCEKFSFDDVLTREKEQAVTPLLADVARIAFVIHVPGEGTLFVEHHALPVIVLIEEKLRGVDLPREHQIAEWS